jgi:beta-glucosidase
MDPSLTVDERVNDLVSRMTLEEKVSQMMNEAPGIKRLGIPAYNWWNECLHGVARAGLATSFPQAIGLGATWDEDLMFRVSTAISDEARAKYHDFQRKGSRLIYQGLTFWSPNINLFRDPRWGRGQETYGEDPFLTGRLGIQFVRGLQGDDPKYLKAIATLKHYAIHSGPEPSRHSFNTVISERDLRESYLPHFEMGIKEGKAWSVMCAYNSFIGEPCCGSNKLLNDILRNEWGFEGYVVSDCGAIYDIYEGHKIVSTPEEASAIAVKSGCDLECMNVYKSLTDAVKKGLITEEEIDVSVKRLFTARFKLGMFDPPEMVKYASIPYDVVDSREHKELALEAARKSIILLKNEYGILPLKKQPGTIAVIGPNSDDWHMMLGNYEGMPSDPVTPLRGIREKLAGIADVLYAKGCELFLSESDVRGQQELRSQALDIADKADVIIMCMGISPRLEGEEMDVKIEGFQGGDRTSLDIPEVQEDLIKEIQSLGKPVVLVLFSGSALAVNWEDKNIPVILEAWYPGQAGGTAIADVIFGDYNPAGRLPVTFYRSVSDLPPFEDYNMKGRTYRYFDGEPLYQFGYGLSYTTFSYANLTIDKQCKSCDSVELTVNVKNTGKLTGDEVVQIYLRNLDATAPVPRFTLIGFKRVFLQPGETRKVIFSIPSRAFSVINEQNERVVIPGRFEFFAGGRQPFTSKGRPAQGVLKAEFIIPENVQ